MTALVTTYKGQFVCGGGRSGAAHCLLFPSLPGSLEPHASTVFTPVTFDSTAGSAIRHFMHGLPIQFLNLRSRYFQYYRTCTLHICIRIWIGTPREPTFDYGRGRDISRHWVQPSILSSVTWVSSTI